MHRSTTSANLSPRLAQIPTIAPSAARASAKPAPIPDEAPVTRARQPFSSNPISPPPSLCWSPQTERHPRSLDKAHFRQLERSRLDVGRTGPNRAEPGRAGLGRAGGHAVSLRAGRPPVGSRCPERCGEFAPRRRSSSCAGGVCRRARSWTPLHSRRPTRP